jgi:hypothetical protein
MKIEIKNDPMKYLQNIIGGQIIEPTYIYRMKPKRNRDKKYMMSMISTIEAKSLSNNEPIQVNKLQNTIPKAEQFMFDYAKIRNTIPHNKMPTDVYDVDIYLLDWRSGDWREILNANPYDFGFDWKKQKIVSIEKEMKRYQYNFLGINNEELKKMIQFYIRDLSWIIDYYMNTWDKNKISSWSYNYERSPFLGQINVFLSNADNEQLDHLFYGTYERSLVPVWKYLNQYQHKFYIYPQEKKNELHAAQKNTSINPKLDLSFPDIKHYVNKTIDNYYNDVNDKKYFDCRLSPYFSKCIFRNRKLTFKELLDVTNTPNASFNQSGSSLQLQRKHVTIPHKQKCIYVKKGESCSSNK